MNEAMEATEKLISEWCWLSNRVTTAQLIERLRKHGLSMEESIDILHVAFTTAIDEARRRKWDS